MRLKNLFPALFSISIDTMSFVIIFSIMTTLLTEPSSPILAANTSEAWRHFYLGLSFLLFPLFLTLGTPFLAELSDNFGRKRILTCCMFGSMLSFLLMGFAVTTSQLWLLFVARAISGLTAGSQPIATAAIMDMSTDKTKPRNMIFVSLAFCMGLVVGPLIGGFLLTNKALGHGTPFYAASCLSFVAMVWVLFSFKNIIQPAKRAISIFRPMLIFIEAFRHRKIRYLAAGFLLMQVGYSLYFQYLLVHMRLHFHYSSQELGSINSMIGLGYLIGLLVLMPIAIKKLQTKTIIMAAGILLGFSVLISGLLSYSEPQWFLAVFIAAVDIMMFTAILTSFSKSVAKDRQGWVMGVGNSMMGLAWVLTGLASNLISYLNTSGLIMLGGIVALASLLLLTRA